MIRQSILLCVLVALSQQVAAQNRSLAESPLGGAPWAASERFTNHQFSSPSHIDPSGQVNRLISQKVDLLSPGLGRYYEALVSGDTRILEREALSFIGEKSTAGLKSIFPSAQVQVGINLDRKLEASIIGLHPIGGWREESDLLHGWQASVVATDSRYTLNNGYVYRKLSADRRFLYGFNSFVDLEFPRNHRRVSVGAEFKSTPLDLNIQRYVPLTSWIDGPNGIQEAAQRGITLDLTAPIPYVPRLKFSTKYSRWDGLNNSAGNAGMTHSLIGQLASNLTLSISRRRIDGLENTTSAFLTYSQNLGANRRESTNLPIIASAAYVHRDMSGRMIEVVQRENTIRKQYGGLVVVTR